jgi:hypothetical protein
MPTLRLLLVGVIVAAVVGLWTATALGATKTLGGTRYLNSGDTVKWSLSESVPHTDAGPASKIHDRGPR